MKRLSLLTLGVASVMVLTGCNAVNSALSTKVDTIEYYRIYDIKTKADVETVSEAIKEGLSNNANPTTKRNIPTGEIPNKPGRFKIESAFKDSNMGALMNMYGGQRGMRMAVCDGAIWTATADRNVTDAPVKVYACLWQYKGGYHIDMYAQLQKTSGGLYEISRQAAYAVVGDPEHWTEKTLLDPIREVSNIPGTKVKLLEAYPKIKTEL